MDVEQIQTLATWVQDVLPLAEGGEFSVEIDPNEIDEARLDALVSAGMTRASVGVQDFDPHIQETIGREQTYDVTRDAVNAIRARGISSLNADILFGLPHQTQRRLTESVQKLLSLSPDRVALYGYAHVPWMAKRQQMIPTDSLPAPEERLALFETARRLFLWDGYQEIGIDHFARKDDGLAVAAMSGRLKRNFQGYTDDSARTLVGVGASAISQFEGGYSQNAPGTSVYARMIGNGTFATQRGHAFQGEDRLRARLIEALMCDFAANLPELRDEFGGWPSRLGKDIESTLREFQGFVRMDDGVLHILPEGRPLTRMIARRFDAYGQAKAGHSLAI